MFVLSLLLCVCFTAATTTSDADEGNTFSASLQGLEIAPKAVTSVYYGNSRLPIFGHLDNPNRAPDKRVYFAMPMVMLVPESAVCEKNVLFGVKTMQFKVIMWNEDFASAVLSRMRQVTDNQKLSSLQVTTLPMEQIRLAWANDHPQLSKFRLNSHWRSYAKQDNVLTFEIVVSPVELCTATVKHLKKRPSSFRSLELQYVLHAARASRKRVAVKAQHILQAKVYAQLKNKADPNTGIAYLNSDDLNELASEAVSNVVASSTTDADYVDSGDTVSLAKLVYDGLATFKQSMAEMTPKMWESTFWQNEFARPDKLTSYLNKMMKKDKGQNHTISVDNKMASSATSASLGLSYMGIGGGFSGSHSGTDKSNVSEDDMRTWLLENHNEVEWTGEKFEVKPMDLYRVNTQQLNQQQDIAVTNVQVHQNERKYRVAVSFPEEAAQGNKTQPTFAISKRLDKVEAAISRVADRIKEIVENNSGAAESQNAIAQLKTAMETRFDVIYATFALQNDVAKYKGHWFKVYNNPSRSWNGSAEVCASHAGVQATALSKDLLQRIEPLIPHGSNWVPHVLVGLQFIKHTTGWQWIDRGTGKVIDIERNNTARPLWLSKNPSLHNSELYGAIYKDRNQEYGVINVLPYIHNIQYVLCQFSNPMYKFKPLRAGHRMTFPHESSVVAGTLAKCTESCRKSAFCRTISYAVKLKDCRHHSAGTMDPKALIVADSSYNIYG